MFDGKPARFKTAFRNTCFIGRWLVDDFPQPHAFDRTTAGSLMISRMV